MMTDGHKDNSVGERKLIWDEENRLLAVDDNGFVSNYWYDADGERTVKTSGESDQVYVNGVFSGGSTNTAKFSLYVSPYLVANQGGRYTKHIYAGSQRIVSKVGDFASYGSDPRRIEYAGANTDGLSVNYKAKYAAQQQVIKDNYKTFDVPYNGTDNDNYADGEGFCCNDGTQGALLEANKARSRTVVKSFKDPNNYENLQFYYHPDHLGSSSYITNLDGEVVQHIEYVPFGEVFIEERNNVWNTPYLFNAKEFDEENGMYYYGARYYEPRLSLWMSTDPMQEKYLDYSSYCYTGNNPIRFSDPNGQDWWDKVKGFGAALVDNATGGLTNIRTYAGRNVSDPKDFNAGLTAGDIASLTVGTIESGTGSAMVASGTSITTVGLVAEGPSLGTSTVVVVIGGADAAVGAGLTAHGAVMMATAGKNLSEKKGHLDTGNSTASNNRGTKVNSKTLWKDSKGNRIDVENPNPGQRPGQIHFQDNKNNKYLYNNKDGRFYYRDPKTNKWDVPAPNRVNEQLSNPNVQRAIQTGNKYLGNE